MKTLFANIRKTFFAGLLFWVPLVITIFVVNFVLQLTIHLLGLIPTQYLSASYIETPLPGFNFIFIILLILLTGWLVNQYIGRIVIRYWETLLKRIPLIRSIYNASKQSINAMFASSGKAFSDVVLVEYPRRDMWSVAFITNDSTEDFDTSSLEGNDYISVYIPTTPNPTSGFIVLVPRKDIRPVDLTTEEALKWVISLGIINPKDHETDKE